MPRHMRTRSGPQDYPHPIDVSMAQSAVYAPTRMSMNGNNYFDMTSSTSAAEPMHLAPHPHSQQMAQASYDGYAAGSGQAVTLPPSHRPSSGAWTFQDDQQLMAARAQGLNWSQIKSTFFPNKTANACRKRHERLAERRDSEDWDNRKYQRMAKEYMNLRKDIWSPLAERTGEKWNIVEQKCMSNGLKNLQTAARAATRFERLQIQSAAGGPITGYDDDSGISGMALTPVDELDPSYSSPETNSSGGGGSGGRGRGHPGAGFHVQQQVPSHPHIQHNVGAAAAAGGNYLGNFAVPAPATAYGSHHPQHHRYASSVSSNASGAGHGYGGGGGGGGSHSDSGSSPYARAPRQSSVDMGIGSIINRSAAGGGGAGGGGGGAL